MELEKLLNKLIKKGWRPRDIETLYIEVKLKHGELHLILPQMGHLWKPIRLLVSKESGLRQFVCENNLIKTKGKRININTEDFDGHKGFFILYGYEYWLVMSALCNENKLEQFLLENIKVGNE